MNKKLSYINDTNRISVIIPAFNAENYLSKAVKSVLEQTYSNFEILIIDDGSSDQTAQIGKNLEKEDARVKLIRNKHFGVAHSRNTGISLATGKYITFLDADDEYETEFLSKMLNGITKNNSDICICGYMSVYTDYNKISNGLEHEEYRYCNRNQMIRMLLNGDISSHPWNKIYSRKIINQLYYPEGKYYEDVFAMNNLVQKIDSAALINYIGVRYYQNNNSIVHQKKDRIEMDAFDAFYERFILFKKEYYEYEEYLLKDPVEIALRLVAKKIIKGTELDNEQLCKIKSFLNKQKFNKKAYAKLCFKYKIALFLWG